MSIDWSRGGAFAWLVFVLSCNSGGMSSTSGSTGMETDAGSGTSWGESSSTANEGTSSETSGGEDVLDGSSSSGDDALWLKEVLEFRLGEDRTGACIAAAVIDAEVQRAIVCADEPRPLTTASAFEIGSITKTMTAVLLADLTQSGVVDLEAPLELYLPKGTVVPTFEGEPIRLSHLVTHTSGLPSLPTEMVLDDPLDPYAGLTEAQMLESLADVDLAAAPGTQWAYSNWGFMLLSYVVTTQADQDLDPLLRDTVFGPLGMTHAYLVDAPPDADVAQGHTPALGAVPAWTIPENLAGVGGVKASLDDMVLYAEAVLGRTGGPTAGLIDQTLEPIEIGGFDLQMGMAWILMPFEGRTVALHDGGTGGFSSLLMVDRDRDRAVVLLSDTAWNVSDDLGVLGSYLFEPEGLEVPPPRRVENAPAALVNALVGRYSVEDVEVELIEDRGVLIGVVDGVPPLEFGYDSHGDFFPSLVDALLHPVELPEGTLTFDWFQDGAAIRAQRLE